MNRQRYRLNDFADKGYVLCRTSDVRRLLVEDRKSSRSVREGRRRAQQAALYGFTSTSCWLLDEIKSRVPNARVFTSGSAEEMVANCDTLVCKYSTLAYVGLALGKEVFSLFDLEELKACSPGRTRAVALATSRTRSAGCSGDGSVDYEAEVKRATGEERPRRREVASGSPHQPPQDSPRGADSHEHRRRHPSPGMGSSRLPAR